MGHQLVEVDAVRKLLSLHVETVPGDFVVTGRQATQAGLIHQPARRCEHPHQHVRGGLPGQGEDEACAQLVVERIRERQRVPQGELAHDLEPVSRSLSSRRVEAHRVLAWTLARQGRKAEAAAEFRKVLELTQDEQIRKEATDALKRLE